MRARTPPLSSDASSIAIAAISQPADVDIVFTPLGEAHLQMLAEWFRRLHVREWWDGPRTIAGVRAEFLEPVGTIGAATPFIAHENGRAVGYVQSYLAVDTGDGWWTGWHDRSVVGIDQFIADAADLGRGLGPAIAAAFVRRLFMDPSISRIVVDPSPLNPRAIRCYRKAGFRDERLIETPDGAALLMEVTRDRFALR